MARLYLTGGLRLDGPTGHVTDADLPGRQGRIAFAALAVERRPLSHDQLADIIWDEAPPPQWKAALAPVMSKIRSLITTTGLDGSEILVAGGGAYRLALPADIWVDLESALAALDRAEGALRHDQDADAARHATVASSILRRPFLTGIDNLWADHVRERLGDALYRCLPPSPRRGLGSAITSWHRRQHRRRSTWIRFARSVIDFSSMPSWREATTVQRGGHT